MNNSKTNRSFGLLCGWCNACDECRRIEIFIRKLRSEGLVLYKGKYSISASFAFHIDTKTAFVEFYLGKSKDGYLAKYRVTYDDVKEIQISKLMDEVVYMLERNVV